MYNAGLITDPGFFGIPELNNFFDTNSFVKSDGSFDYGTFILLCEKYNLNPENYNILYSIDNLDNNDSSIAGNIKITDAQGNVKTIDFDVSQEQIAYLEQNNIDKTNADEPEQPEEPKPTWTDKYGNVHNGTKEEWDEKANQLGFNSADDYIDSMKYGLENSSKSYYFVKNWEQVSGQEAKIYESDSDFAQSFWNAYNQGDDALMAWWNRYMNPTGKYNGSGFASSWYSHFGSSGGGDDDGILGGSGEIDWKEVCSNFLDMLKGRKGASAPDTEDHAQDKA